jgi:hypothetical protein
MLANLGEKKKSKQSDSSNFFGLPHDIINRVTTNNSEEKGQVHISNS